ncbi:MAG TPA: STAS domain-containing protein [Telluria sp.]|nr:STAS domain-containing protein [Telluria sp.]
MLTVEAITFENARTALEQGCAAIRGGQREIDLGGIKAADSSAVAVLLAWQRTAKALGASLTFHNIPAGMLSLATVYGVDGLLA